MMFEANRNLYSTSGKSKFNFILNIVIAAVAAVLVFELVFVSNYTGVYVVDISMTPTLHGASDENSPGGDYVYVSKSAKPDYGDIVVVTRSNDTPLIKRAIAFEGDSVKIIAGQLYVKYAGREEFEFVEESYIFEEYNNPSLNINNYPQTGGKVREEGHKVNKGEVFLLGDNRNYSSDSRQNGNFKTENVYGVVTGWSMRNKKFISSAHKFFRFKLPSYFGIKKD